MKPSSALTRLRACGNSAEVLGSSDTSLSSRTCVRRSTITTSNVFAREGLLMSYGSDLGSIWRLAAHYTAEAGSSSRSDTWIGSRRCIAGPM